jgi:hypothetical protein
MALAALRPGLAGEAGSEDEVVELSQALNKCATFGVVEGECADVAPDGGVVEVAVADAGLEDADWVVCFFDIADRSPAEEVLGGEGSATCSGK